MADVNKGCLEVMGILFLFLVNFVIGIALRGYVLMKLWLWFVVPILKAPTINMVQAYGLSLIFSFLIMGLAKEKEKKENQSALALMMEGTLIMLFGYGILLLLGYIFSQWM